MNILLLTLKLLPAILTVVQSIETAAPVAKSGAQKLELILDVVLAAISSDSSVESETLPKDKLTKLIQSIVEKAVSFLNLLGIFRKS